VYRLIILLLRINITGKSKS